MAVEEMTFGTLIKIVILLGTFFLLALFIYQEGNNIWNALLYPFCEDNPGLCGDLGIDTTPSVEEKIADASFQEITESINEVGAPPLDEEYADMTCKQQGQWLWEYCKPSEGLVCPEDAVAETVGDNRGNSFKCCRMNDDGSSNCVRTGSAAPSGSQEQPGSAVSFQGATTASFQSEDLTDLTTDEIRDKLNIRGETTEVRTYGQLYYDAELFGDEVWFVFDYRDGWKYRCDDCSPIAYREWRKATDPLWDAEFHNSLDPAIREIIQTMREQPTGREGFEAGITKIAELLNATGFGGSSDDEATILWEYRIKDVGNAGGTTLGQMNDRFVTEEINDNNMVYCLWDIAAPYMDKDPQFIYRWHGGGAQLYEDMWFTFHEGRWKWKAAWADSWEIKELGKFFAHYWNNETYKQYIDDVSLPVIVRELQAEANVLRTPQWRYQRGVNIIEDAVNRWDDDSVWFRYVNEQGQGMAFPADNVDIDRIFCLRRMLSGSAPVVTRTINSLQIPQDVTGWENYLPFYGDPDMLVYWQSFPPDEVTWNTPGWFAVSAAFIIATSLPPLKTLKILGPAVKTARAGLLGEKIAAKTIPKITGFAPKATARQLLKQAIKEATVDKLTQSLPKLGEKLLAARGPAGAAALKRVAFEGVPGVGKVIIKQPGRKLALLPAAWAAALFDSMNEKYYEYGNSLVFKVPFGKPNVSALKPELQQRLVLLNWEPGRAIPGFGNWLEQVMSFKQAAPFHLVSPCNLETTELVPFVATCEIYEHRFDTTDNDGSPVYYTKCIPDPGDPGDPKEFSGHMSFDLGDTEPSCLLPLRFISKGLQEYEQSDPFDAIRQKDVDDVVVIVQENSYVNINIADQNGDGVNDTLVLGAERTEKEFNMIFYISTIGLPGFTTPPDRKVLREPYYDPETGEHIGWNYIESEGDRFFEEGTVVGRFIADPTLGLNIDPEYPDIRFGYGDAYDSELGEGVWDFISFYRDGYWIEERLIIIDGFEHFPYYKLWDSDYDGHFDTFTTNGECKIDGTMWVIPENSKVTGEGNNYCFDERGGLETALEWGGITLGVVGAIASVFTMSPVMILIAGGMVVMGGAMELEAAWEEYQGIWPGDEVT